jgi:hypothetical protein
MRLLLVLIPLLSALTLGGCTRPDGPVYTPPESASGRLCTAHCSETHNTCQSDCSLQQRECLNKAQAQALVDYEQYMSEPFLHANVIEHHERDFEHLDPCKHAFESCSTACETPYQMCYTKCGGEVETPSSCLLCFW